MPAVERLGHAFLVALQVSDAFSYFHVGGGLLSGFEGFEYCALAFHSM